MGGQSVAEPAPLEANEGAPPKKSRRLSRKTSCVDVGPTQSQSQPSQCDEPGPDTAPSTIAGMFDSCMRSSRAAMAGKAKDKVPDDLSIFDEVRVCRTQLDEQYPG